MYEMAVPQAQLSRAEPPLMWQQQQLIELSSVSDLILQLQELEAWAFPGHAPWGSRFTGHSWRG